MAYDLIKAMGRQRTLERTGPRTIDELTFEILDLKQQAGDAILAIGRRLIEAKEMLPHGEWLPWLTERVEFSERTAQNFMRLAKAYSGNPQLVADLGASKAVTLLALPEKEREKFLAEPQTVDGKTKPAADLTRREFEQAVRQKAGRQEKAPSVRTNGDRLRAMNDGDLAQFIAEQIAESTIPHMESSGRAITAMEKRALTHRLRMTWQGWLGRPAETE